MYVPTNNLASKIAPHVYSALRDQCVIFDKSILSSSPKLTGVYCAVNAES